MSRKRIRYFIVLGIGLAVLIGLFCWAPGAIRTFITPHWPTLLAAASLTILFPFCMALRWVAILWACGYRVRYGQAVAITMAAFPLGTITPSKSGDLAKALCVRDQVPLAVGLGSVVTERALDVAILLALSLVGALALHENGIALFAALGLLCAIGGWTVVAIGWRLPVGEKWSERLERFGETARVLLRRPGYLALAVAAASVNWLLSIWQTYLLYRAYDAEPSFLFVCAALPVAIFIGLLPLTPAGMGTREAAMIRLFGPVPKEISISVGVVYALCGYWLPSLVGLPFTRKLLGRAPEEARSK